MDGARTTDTPAHLKGLAANIVSKKRDGGKYLHPGTRVQHSRVPTQIKKHSCKTSTILKAELTCCQRGEDSGVRYRRAHVPEYGRAEDAGEAVVKEFHITVAQSPRQGAHEGEHDAHGAEGAPARVRYNVAQDLDARKHASKRRSKLWRPRGWVGGWE